MRNGAMASAIPSSTLPVPHSAGPTRKASHAITASRFGRAGCTGFSLNPVYNVGRCYYRRRSTGRGNVLAYSSRRHKTRTRLRGGSDDPPDFFAMSAADAARRFAASPNGSSPAGLWPDLGQLVQHRRIGNASTTIRTCTTRKTIGAASTTAGRIACTTATQPKCESPSTTAIGSTTIRLHARITKGLTSSSTSSNRRPVASRLSLAAAFVASRQYVSSGGTPCQRAF